MVQLDLKKTYHTQKAIYVLNDDYFISVGLQLTNRKIGKIVTLYKQEVFKKIPHLGTFCTQSVNEGLIYNWAGVCSLLTSFLNSFLLGDMFLNLIEASFTFIMASE